MVTFVSFTDDLFFVTELKESTVEISKPPIITVKSTTALSSISPTAPASESHVEQVATTVEISGLQVIAYNVGTANQSYVCPSPECGRVYRWQYTLLRHYREECGREPRFQCRLCDHRSRQRHTLVRHMWSAHRVLERVNNR